MTQVSNISAAFAITLIAHFRYFDRYNVTSGNGEQVLHILSGARKQFAKYRGRALITDDDEAIEGEAAEELEVLGRVTFFINSANADDKSPV